MQMVVNERGSIYTQYEVMVMSFAEKLQTLRKEKGMSQESLADLAGVSRQAVSKWESGQSYPEMDKLITLSDLFGVTIDFLVKENPTETAEDEPECRNSMRLPLRPHYEYKSARTLFGLPLVHVNVGCGMYKAKGIVAVGNVAVGFLSVGIVSLGLLSVGAVAAGLIALAGFAFGLLLSFGGIAVGTVAAGGVAVGIVALGGLSVGMFSLGGCAVASNIAVGGFASGHIAIGDTVKGANTIAIQNHNFGSVPAQQVRDLINREYPGLWQPLADFLLFLFH